MVTMDETCDLETKQQSMKWRHSVSLRPSPKKFRVQKSAGKVLASIVWDKDGILLIDYVPKGQTVNAEYYSFLLVQLKDILKKKCYTGEGHKGSLVLAKQCPRSPGTCTPEENGLPWILVS
jgi:hypothetical protein